MMYDLVSVNNYILNLMILRHTVYLAIEPCCGKQTFAFTPSPSHLGLDLILLVLVHFCLASVAWKGFWIIFVSFKEAERGN